MSISVISRFRLKLADSPLATPGETSAIAQLPRYRWFALGVLFLVSVLNTVDKMTISASFYYIAARRLDTQDPALHREVADRG